MTLNNIKLTNFRNLKGEYSLSKGINIIIAPNGSGKTNFLEAVNFLATGKSFRTNSEGYCIDNKLSNSLALTRIEGNIVDALGNETLIEILLESNSSTEGCKKTLRINSNKVFLSKFLGHFYTIVFSPDTIDLVSGSPSVRRKDLDDFLSLYDEVYFDKISEYKKVIQSRNRLLEKFLEQGLKGDELKFWNQRLIDLGSCIIDKRLKFIKKVNLILSKLSAQLFNHKDLDSAHLAASYVSKFIQKPKLEDILVALKQKISENIKKEIRAGVTLYGPHREDFALLLAGKDLRGFGSRGEQRLCAFSYKIAQWCILKEKVQSYPTLLLDDLFSELDEKVCENMQKFLQRLEAQIVLTASKRGGFDKDFLEEVHEISL